MTGNDGEHVANDASRDGEADLKDNTSFLKALWRGEIPLGETFWKYGVLVYVVFFAVPLIILASFKGGVSTFLQLLLLGLMFVYILFISGAIWRSASKYDESFLMRWLAKIVVVMLVLSAFNGLMRIF